MELNISKKIGGKWKALIRIAPSKFKPENLQANVSLSDARILVHLIETEGKEYNGEKYLYLPAFENRPKAQHTIDKGNAYVKSDFDEPMPNFDDSEIPF